MRWLLLVVAGLALAAASVLATAPRAQHEWSRNWRVAPDDGPLRAELVIDTERGQLRSDVGLTTSLAPGRPVEPYVLGQGDGIVVITVSDPAGEIVVRQRGGPGRWVDASVPVGADGRYTIEIAGKGDVPGVVLDLGGVGQRPPVVQRLAAISALAALAGLAVASGLVPVRRVRGRRVPAGPGPSRSDRIAARCLGVAGCSLFVGLLTPAGGTEWSWAWAFPVLMAAALLVLTVGFLVGSAGAGTASGPSPPVGGRDGDPVSTAPSPRRTAPMRPPVGRNVR